MGLCYNIALIFSYENRYPENTYIETVGEIYSNKEEKVYCNKYIVRIKNIKIILYTKKENNFLPGDIVSIKGKFEKAEASRNYKGFNYRNYLKQKRIYGIINAESIVKINHNTNFNSIIGMIKYNLYSRIEHLYNKEYNNFLKGILLGNTEGLEEKIKEDFRNSNISHILAISGMHVTYIIIGIKYFLDKLNLNKIKQNYILIGFLVLFLIVTGFSVSCIRACIMSAISIISFNLERKNNFYRSLMFTFILVIFVNPFNIFNIGMWLSFLSTLSIVLFNKFFIRLFQIKFKRKKISIIYKNIILSISAQILIIPIIIYTFNTISLTFFISNVLVSLIIAPVLMLGYLSIIVSFIFMPIAKILVYIESCLIYIVLKISEICARLPFSKIYICTPSTITIIIYYCMIFSIVKYYKIYKFFIIKMILSFKNMKKYIRNSKLFEKEYKDIIKIIIVLLIIVILSNNINVFDFRLKIYFVDVSQGDCTVIVTPKGKNIIIDGGEGNSEKYDYGKNVVLPYLLDRHIKKIDFLIVSHRR